MLALKATSAEGLGNIEKDLSSDQIQSMSEPLGTTELIDERVKAKMQGYEGDPCGDCGNFTLVRNGTCMKCNTCGGTTGCS